MDVHVGNHLVLPTMIYINVSTAGMYNVHNVNSNVRSVQGFTCNSFAVFTVLVHNVDGEQCGAMF